MTTGRISIYANLMGYEAGAETMRALLLPLMAQEKTYIYLQSLKTTETNYGFGYELIVVRFFNNKAII